MVPYPHPLGAKSVFLLVGLCISNKVPQVILVLLLADLMSVLFLVFLI